MSHLSAPIPTALPVRREVEELLDRLAAVETPVVSLYLDTHAGTDPNAPAQRADAVLRQLPLERAVRDHAERALGEVLRGASEGTLAFFCTEDPDAFTASRFLRVAPKVDGLERSAAARWGVPWTDPLTALLDTEPPVVAVFADARRARVFVYDLGEASEASAYVRALDPSGWRRYQEAETGMPGRVARGGSGRDDFEARKEAWTQRFVASVVQQVETAVAARDGTRLALIGDARHRRELENALPQPLRRLVLTQAAAPADPDQDAAHWTAPLAELIREALDAEQAHDEALGGAA